MYLVSDMNVRFCQLKCSDGLHLTNGGNQIVFHEVIRKLREEGLTRETLPADLPLIDDIDPNDPLKAFL